jgi:hypothetical protein
MGIRFKLNLLPAFLPGEKVLYFKKWLWFCSGLSFPNYRIFFSLPPLWEGALYVTNRRVLFVGYLFRFINQEFDQWFELEEKPPDTEIIRGVRVGKNRLLGSYLEIISGNSVKHWYRSSKVRIRLYIKDAEIVDRIVKDLCGRIDAVLK